MKSEISFDKTNKPFEPDYDMGMTCNRLFPLDMSAAVDCNIKPRGERKIKALLGGDSFCHALVWGGLFFENFHPQSEFWYYNHHRSTKDSADLKLTPESYKGFEKFDCIIFLYSGLNLPCTDYGLIDSVNKYRPVEDVKILKKP
jgi:hypothetical protein